MLPLPIFSLLFSEYDILSYLLFLHMSGQAEIIDKALNDFEDCGGLAPSGSTNIEDLLAVSGLSLLPSNDTKRPIPKSLQRSTVLRARTLDTENKP